MVLIRSLGVIPLTSNIPPFTSRLLVPNFFRGSSPTTTATLWPNETSSYYGELGAKGSFFPPHPRASFSFEFSPRDREKTEKEDLTLALTLTSTLANLSLTLNVLCGEKGTIIIEEGGKFQRAVIIIKTIE